MEEDIYRVLKDDHRHVEDLFEEIKECLQYHDTGRLPSLFLELKTELTAHAKAEQEVFYEPLRIMSRSEEGDELAWEGEEEHHVVFLLLNELSRLPIGSDQWAAKIKVLSEIVDHHVKEEEGEIFSEARKVFNEDDARLMARNLEELKDIYKGMVDDALEEDVQIFNAPLTSSSRGRSSEYLAG